MSAQYFESMLFEIFEHGEDDCTSCTFRHVDPSTNKNGLIIAMHDGSEFHITIDKVK